MIYLIIILVLLSCILVFRAISKQYKISVIVRRIEEHLTYSESDIERFEYLFYKDLMLSSLLTDTQARHYKAYFQAFGQLIELEYPKKKALEVIMRDAKTKTPEEACGWGKTGEAWDLGNFLYEQLELRAIAEEWPCPFKAYKRWEDLFVDNIGLGWK